MNVSVPDTSVLSVDHAYGTLSNPMYRFEDVVRPA